VSTKTRIVTQREVPSLLEMGDCMELMTRTLKTVAEGDALQPLRTMTWMPSRIGGLGLMPSLLGDPASLGVKVISVFPGNTDTPYDSHQGAGDLALLGIGVQARTHLEAMRRARPIRRVRVYSPNAARSVAFADRESERHGITVEVADTARAAVEGADIICTCTSAREPVLHGDWVARGVHINAVGACVPKCRELDTALVRNSSLFVDRRESAKSEAGDFLIPKKEGAIGDDHIRAEFGEVLLTRSPSRTAEDEITVFKSLGIAVEDLASAHHIYRRAIETDRGLEVEFGGGRHAEG